MPHDKFALSCKVTWNSIYSWWSIKPDSRHGNRSEDLPNILRIELLLCVSSGSLLTALEEEGGSKKDISINIKIYLLMHFVKCTCFGQANISTEN